jgi:hypothetical protein
MVRLDIVDVVAKSDSNTMADRPTKHFILAFLLALVCYVVLYRGCEYRRTRKGPWQVTFTTNSTGFPLLVINQPMLAITNVQVNFPDQSVPTNTALGTQLFGEPREVPFAVPFGTCVFMDATFLPGTVAFKLFGHDIQLMPRVLITDSQERPWYARTPVTLHPVSERDLGR